ncbi:MAG: c-type cytochrome domain-containing protein [Pirellula sp.]
MLKRLFEIRCFPWTTYIVIAWMVPFWMIGWTKSHAANPADSVSFANQIAPVLFENCIACHGPKKAEGGYRIDTYTELQKPGDSGAVPVVPSGASAGELLKRIKSSDPSDRMPAESDPLPREQIESIEQWILQGAKFDGKTASDPLQLVVPPKTYPAPPSSYKHAVPIAAMAFSPDGKQLLVGGYREITVWSCEENKLLRRISNVGPSVNSIVFLPDDIRIAVGCGEPGIRGEVRILDFASGQLQAVTARANDLVLDIAVRLGTSEIAVAAADSLIRIVDTTAMSEIRTIASHADAVTSVSWNEDGTRLASVSRDKSAKVYDSSTGELLVSYSGHGASVRGIVFSSNGKDALTAGGDLKLHRWAIEGGKKSVEVNVAGEAFKLKRTGEHVYVPSTDGKCRQIDLNNNQVTRLYEGPSEWILSMAVHLGTKRVAAGYRNGEVHIWNLETGEPVRNWVAKP